jgi:hypothetical protein
LCRGRSDGDHEVNVLRLEVLGNGDGGGEVSLRARQQVFDIYVAFITGGSERIDDSLLYCIESRVFDDLTDSDLERRRSGRQSHYSNDESNEYYYI